MREDPRAGVAVILGKLRKSILVGFSSALAFRRRQFWLSLRILRELQSLHREVHYIIRLLTQEKNAVMVVFVDEKGDPVMDVLLKVGETKTYKAVLRKLDESVDTTFTDEVYSYDNGTLTAADGSSSGVQTGLQIAITGLAASPKDADGVAAPSTLTFGVDADDTDGKALLTNTLSVSVLAPEENAVRVDFEEVTAAPASARRR
jgi:hypothetical protein